MREEEKGFEGSEEVQKKIRPMQGKERKRNEDEEEELP